jgi:uncharacterized protein
MKANTLYLGVTNDCNLKCTYCMRPKAVDYMDEEVARKAVQWFVEQLPEEPTPNITFWGGEPCMNKTAVLAAINEVERLIPGKSTFTISTNGYDLPDELFDEIAFKSKRWAVQISLDGKKESHDKNRPSIDGDSSFDKAIATFKKLNGICNIALRATITPWNVHNLFEDMRYLRLLTPSFNVRPMFQASWKNKHYDGLRKGLLQYAQYEVERVAAGDKPSKVAAHPFSSCGIQFSGMCGAGREMMYVDAAGNIWPCADHEDVGRHLLGNIDDGIDYITHSKRLFEELSIENFIGCKQCTAISCTACHALNLGQTGCEVLPPEGYCRAMRIFGEFYAVLQTELQKLGYYHEYKVPARYAMFDDDSFSLLIKEGNKMIGRKYQDINAATLDTLFRVTTLLERLKKDGENRRGNTEHAGCACVCPAAD